MADLLVDGPQLFGAALREARPHVQRGLLVSNPFAGGGGAAQEGGLLHLTQPQPGLLLALDEPGQVLDGRHVHGQAARGEGGGTLGGGVQGKGASGACRQIQRLLIHVLMGLQDWRCGLLLSQKSRSGCPHSRFPRVADGGCGLR